MEDIKPILEGSTVSEPNKATPFTLQYLCSKIILLEVNSSNKEEKSFPNEIDREKNPTNNMLFNNLGADLSQNLHLSPDLVNCNFCPENFNLDMNLEKWDLEEFDSMIQDLRTNDSLSNIENDISELGDVSFGLFNKTQADNTHTNDIFDKEFVAYSGHNLANERAPANNSETDDKDSIILISSDDSDFHFSLTDIDQISISSLETYENKNQSKVIIELSPQIQYITDFNETKESDISNSISSKTVTKNTNENISTISISSNENHNLDDSFCSGYNSDDFEFITEEDAKTNGLIIKEETNEVPNNTTNRTVEARAHNANTSQMSSTSNNCNTEYRNKHQIPEGDDYVDLFRGHYAPTTPWLFENKCMGLLLNEYAGLGFDIAVLSRQIKKYQPDDEYKEEAEDCAKKILNMYPSENRKRRRRFY